VTTVIADLNRTLPLPDGGHTGPDGGAVAEPGPGTGARRLLGVLLVAVGLVLVASGGYTAYQNRHGTRGSTPPGVRTVPGSASPDATPTPPTASPPTPTPTAVGASPLVTVAPALSGQPDVAAVADTLTTYFTAINERDYDAYRSVLVDVEDRVGGEADFLRRFRSTTDSDVRLVGVRHDPDGGVMATVTFRSTQDPADAPDGVSACVSWVLTYPMTAADDGTLLIDVVHLFAQTYRPC
jgi:hypothetical protein